MPATIKKIRKINKDQLHKVVFCNSVGYFTEAEIRECNRRLQLSMLMAKVPEANVKIVFNTVDGYYEVAASVWGSTEKHILINGDSLIPVGAVAWVSLNAASLILHN